MPRASLLSRKKTEMFLFHTVTLFSILKQVRVRWGGDSESEAMGCTSAKQVSAVPNDEEGRGKAYSNGDLYGGQHAHAHTHTDTHTCLHVSIKPPQLHFTLLIAQLWPVNPSVLSIYCLYYHSKGLWQRVHFLFSKQQRQIFIGVVDIDSSCKREEVTVTHTRI